MARQRNKRPCNTHTQLQCNKSKIVLSIMHLLLCDDFYGLLRFLQMMGPRRCRFTRNFPPLSNASSSSRTPGVVTLWLPDASFQLFCLVRGDRLLSARHASRRRKPPLRTDSLQPANWLITSVSSANFQPRWAHALHARGHIILLHEEKNLTIMAIMTGDGE